MNNGIDYDKVSVWAKKQLRDGIDFKLGRNKVWFALAVDLAKSGFSEDQAIEILSTKFQEEHDFKEKEFLTAVNSGFKYITK